MSLGHVIELMTCQAWALHEPTLRQLRDLVARHEGGTRLTAEQADEAVRAAGGTPRREPRPAETSDGVAVLPVQGVIARRANMVNGSSQPKGTSIEQLDAQLTAALEDPTVHSILLDVDSPGGSVAGVPEFAQRIRESSKPVHAVADGMMASAAYWIASGAKRIVSTRAAAVGSIGVYAVVDDFHRRYATAGVDSTLIASGPRKGAGTPGTVVTEEHKASLRETVQSYAGLFFQDVGAARGLQSEALDRVTTGQTWIGGQAVELGLVDALGTRESTLAELRAAAAPTAAQPGNQVAASVPHPQSEQFSEGNMDLKNLDAATLRAQRPDLVTGIEQSASEAAVKNERERIAAIVRLGQKAGVDAETQQKAIAEGWTRERAAEAFLDIAAERKEARIEQIRKTTPESSNKPADGVETVKETGMPAKTTATDPKSMPMGVERFKAEYAADPKLRAEFPDEANYVAFRKSEEGIVGAR
jgi:signal peptide peptidase SppA